MEIRIITIGRDNSCDIVISDPRVSRIHANIFQDRHGYIYRDTSTNGTLVNGMNIKRSDLYIQYGDPVFLAGLVPLPWGKVRSLLPSETIYQSSHMDTQVLHTPFHPPNPYPDSDLSGSPDRRPAELPVHLKDWNWGAFGLYPLWGFANGMWWLLFIRFLLFWMEPVPCIIFGVYGSQWAWKSKQWRDLDHFVAVQQSWKAWGIVASVFGLLFWFFFVIDFISEM
ncbi:MAG: FHA domain-containing protein [Mangrovibacterium sp.]